MFDDDVSWSVISLICAAILVVVYFISVLLGVNELNFVNFGVNFLLGSAIGYVVWYLYYQL